ncbi:ferritin-3, chloroplastic-like [Vigna umbellata]|uniref:ferritin-3, chloroplastic-like n=1 Tax=Vigna umbellata TaxID=87088 RepID=UPI001F5FD3CC|nr:ferritin-3, chloroplastic-like [Vigna umbellata]XP_047175650.1 ferritin-3, chloroplastic-like [Vigna umbellata]
MILGSSSSVCVSLSERLKLGPSLSSSGPFFKPENGVRFSKSNGDCGVVAKAMMNEPILNTAFEPFEEVKKELLVIPTELHASLARQNYTDQSEAALNAQINVEYNVSYVYHAMYAYFDRDNVALKGLAKFFKDASMEERQHAETMMEYQNKRGGKVQLLSMIMPFSEFDHAEKGDALYAMELALSLERMNNEKLLNLHRLASENNDAQFVDFLESHFLVDQVEDIKKISEYVAQLRRVGKGHGVWHFDQMLLNGGVAA